MSWLDSLAPFGALGAAEQAELAALPATQVPSEQTLFRPGDTPQGFVIVLKGRIDVYLTGPTGREIVLYSVTPGKTCIQTTIGLLGTQEYTGEAITTQPSEIVMIPRALFAKLIDSSKPFREFVFQAFGERLQDMMQVLERVAFHKVEARLARDLLERADGNVLSTTQSDIAAHIGSAREVVARQLDSFAKRGLIERERGLIRIIRPEKLRDIADISRDL